MGHLAPCTHHAMPSNAKMIWASLIRFLFQDVVEPPHSWANAGGPPFTGRRRTAGGKTDRQTGSTEKKCFRSKKGDLSLSNLRDRD